MLLICFQLKRVKRNAAQSLPSNLKENCACAINHSFLESDVMNLYLVTEMSLAPVTSHKSTFSMKISHL